MDMEPITLSRQIDRMQAAGLIERRPDPHDRRAYRLFLTDAARPLVLQFRGVATQCLTDALAGISDAEVDTVVDILTRIRANLVARPESEAGATRPAANEPESKAS
jgi:DNA-binding MarR family transcriptional regulator